jgi:hypothetical protein
MTPLQVYLDSSDFSTLSSAEPGSEVTRTLQALVTLRDNRRIDLPFSYPHIAEAAPISKEAMTYARARGLCIESLCAGHTIMCPFSLLKAEVGAIARGIPVSRGGLYSTDGRWWPPFEADDAELALTPRAILRQLATARGMTGAARSDQLRRWLSNSGQPLPAGRQVLEQLWPEYIAGLLKKTPLSKRGIDTLRSMWFGQPGSGNLLTEMTEDALRSPPVVIEWFARDWHAASPSTSWLRRDGALICKVIGDGITAAQNLRTQQILSGTAPEEVARMESAARANGAERLATSLANAISVKCQAGPIRGLPDNWRTLAPGLATLVSVASEVQRRAIELSAQMRKPTNSDLGDMLHMVYLPYVDVFRTDGPMADILDHSGAPAGATIVRTLGGLIEVIEELLAARSRET